MNSVVFNLESEFLKNIFSEDIYIIQDKGSVDVSKKEEASKIIQEIKIEIPAEIRRIAVVAKSENEIIANKDLLVKILKAVGINWDEVGLITEDQNSKQIQYQSYLIFGIENKILLDFKSQPNINQIQIQGSQKFIFTHSLAELETSVDKKKGLWAILQQAFLNQK